MGDLRPHLASVRDQSVRGTCLSIALTDGHHVARGEPPTLSVDYLHYHAAMRHEVNVNDGVSTDAARAALAEDGQPAEAECPYSFAALAPDWEPPAPVGRVWRRQTRSAAPSWEVVREELENARPAVLILGITDAFWDATDGIVETTDGDARASHAVLVVALGTNSETVLVRNSWGPDWGHNGYAWLSADYVRARCTDVIIFGEDRS
jgi:hypothetical protein